MAQALEQQLTQSCISAMSFEERLALLVDREVHGRPVRRGARLLKTVKLKYPQAAIEDLDSRSTRGLERGAVMSLALGEWVKAGHAVLITGASGAGAKLRLQGGLAGQINVFIHKSPLRKVRSTATARPCRCAGPCRTRRCW